MVMEVHAGLTSTTAEAMPTLFCQCWKMKSGSSGAWPPCRSSSRAFHISLMLFSVSRLLRCLLRICAAKHTGQTPSHYEMWWT